MPANPSTLVSVGVQYDLNQVTRSTMEAGRHAQSILNKQIQPKIDDRQFGRSLGRITGYTSEFTRSLDAANARVLAFGASAGSIFLVQKAMSELLKSTFEVEKSLKDISVVLGITGKELDKFGDRLFDTAKSTGQSFKTVATAATELSRQGLSVEETLKRTRDALILTQLSGLDAKAATESLTATINSFNKVMLDSTQIVNKFASVDAAFAVSSADLAEAIKRVGSTAEDAGVDLDNLIALVTSAQQTTARGGAVIGNALKTIFTRLGDETTLDKLAKVGIAVRDQSGNINSATEILQNLAASFDTLDQSQQNFIAKTVGQQYQINILRSILKDLNRDFSTYESALDTSTNASSEAIRRSRELNETFSAMTNRLVQNFAQLGSAFGKGALGGPMSSFLKFSNNLLESVNGSGKEDAEKTGSGIGEGLMRGIGNYISGPGAATLLIVVGNLVKRLGADSIGALKNLLIQNTTRQQAVVLEERLVNIMAANKGVQEQLIRGEITQVQAKQRYITLLQEELMLNERNSAFRKSVAYGALNTVASVAIRPGKEPITRPIVGRGVPGFANTSGVPNFAIIASAYKTKAGKVYTGRYHGEAYERIPENERVGNLTSGFVDDKKGFLTRELAMVEARNAKQLYQGFLTKEAAATNEGKVYASKLDSAFLRLPNFANPLSSALSREANYVNQSLIRVGQSSSLRSAHNPSGLGVYNLRDEPGGLGQGISRALKEGKNPKTYGLPNFASEFKSYSASGNKREQLVIPAYQESIQTILNTLKDQARQGMLAIEDAKVSAMLAKEAFSLTVTSAKKFERELVQTIEHKKVWDKIKEAEIKEIRKTINPVAVGNNYGRADIIARKVEEQKIRRQQELAKNISVASRYGFTEMPRDFITGPKPGVPAVHEELYGGRIGENFLVSDFSKRASKNDEQRELMADQNAVLRKKERVAAELQNTLVNQEIAKQAAELEKGKRITDLRARGSNILDFQGLRGAINGKGSFRDALGSTSLAKLKELSPADYEDTKRARQSNIQQKYLGASISLPIVFGVASQAIENRKLRSATEGLGNVASFTALGGSIGGPVGAGVGLGAGLVTSVPKVLDEFNKKLPDLIKGIESASNSFAKLQGDLQSFTRITERLNQISEGRVKYTTNEKADLLADRSSLLATLPPKLAAQLSGESSEKEIGDAITKYLRQKSSEVNLQKSGGDALGFLEGGSIKTRNQILGFGTNWSGLAPGGKGYLGISPAIDALTPNRSFGLDKEGTGLTVEGQAIAEQLVSDLFRTTNQDNESFGKFLKKEGVNFSKLFNNQDGLQLKKLLTKFGGEDLATRHAGSIYALDLANERIGQGGESATGGKAFFTALQKASGRHVRGLEDSTINPDKSFNYRRSNTISLENENFNNSILAQRELANLEISEASGLAKLSSKNRISEAIDEANQKIAALYLDPIEQTNKELETQTRSISNRASETVASEIASSLQSLFSEYSKTESVLSDAIKSNLEATTLGQENGAKTISNAQRASLHSLGGIGIREILNNQSSPTDALVRAQSLLNQKIETKKTTTDTVLEEQLKAEITALRQVVTLLESHIQKTQKARAVTELSAEEQTKLAEITSGGLREQIRLTNKLANSNADFPISQFLLNEQSGRKFSSKSARLETGFGLRNVTTESQLAIKRGFNPLSDIRSESAFNIEKIKQDQQKSGLGLKRDFTKSITGLNTGFNNSTNFGTQLNASFSDLSAAARGGDRAGIESGITELKAIEKFGEEQGLDVSSIKKLIADIFNGIEDYDNSIKELNKATKNNIEIEKLKSKAAEFYLNNRVKEAQGGRSAANLRQAIGARNDFNSASGNLSFKDIGEEFAGVFDYRSQDFFDDFRKGAVETAETFKSSFKDAFQSFRDGSKSSSEAWRGFLLSMAQQVQSKTLDIALNSLLGGVAGLFKTNRANGGPIKKYASGGYVTGGSGVRDDVPALLGDGEYVVKRSTVGKYGRSFFESLNNSASASLSNSLGYEGSRAGTRGILDVDPNLSTYALDDENNPQNNLRRQRQDALYSYIQSAKEYENQKVEALLQYKRGRRQAFIAAHLQAGAGFASMGIGAAGSGSKGTKGTVGFGTPSSGMPLNAYNVATGGLMTNFGVRGYAAGGLVDNVPAMLTGGEFVMNRGAVNKYGSAFFDGVNRGVIPGYANGGVVGDSIYKGSTELNDYFEQLIELNASIRDLLVGSNGQPVSKVNAVTGASGGSNYVTINIEMAADGKSESSSSKSSDDKKENGGDNLQKFGKIIEGQVLQTIVNEKRPGGLLYRT